MGRILAIIFMLCCAVAARGQQRSESMVRIDGRDFYVHVVGQGDTAAALAKTYGTTVEQITLNNPQAVTALREGMLLKIPSGAAPVVQSQVQEQAAPVNTVQSYIVRVGDTLYSLSKRFGITVAAIEAANGGLREGLKSGMTIVIPIGGDGFSGAKAGMQAVEAVRQIERAVSVGAGDASVTFGGNSDHLKISLLLPLEDTLHRTDKRFVDFYRGALLGLEDLKAQGVSAEVKLFNVPRSEMAVEEIVYSSDFEGTGLVIGPVYDDGLGYVTGWARAQGVPVVSPLSTHENYTNAALYQMAPAPERKWDKLRAMLSAEGVNVVYLKTAWPDNEMDGALRDVLAGAHTVVFNESTQGATLARLFDRGAAENIYVVSCINSQYVSKILPLISSMYQDLTSRSLTSSRLRTVGSAQWAWFSPGYPVDRELYFKVGVCYVTNYHVDRTDARVRAFDARYIAAFGEVPPSAPGASPGLREIRVLPYAYRGYDAVKLFAGTPIYSDAYDYARRLSESEVELLQVGYGFEQAVGGDWRNINWSLVSYRPDYTIELL